MPSAAHSEKLSPTLRTILVLLTLSIFINYIDRGNLSVAAPLLRDELRLSPTELGILLSAFFWSYTAFQIPSGWLIDRVDVTWVLAFGFFIWSCATSVTGLMHGFVALLAVRLVLGVGEAVAYPSYAKILARDFSIRHRGLGNGAIAAGQFTGPAVATFAGGILMADFGWRPFFIVLGLISLAWVIPWLLYTRPLRTRPVLDASMVNSGEGGQSDLELEATRAELNLQSASASRNAHSAERKPPPLSAILQERSFSGACIAHFACNYLTYFLLTWLPYYLVRQRHFSMENMAKIGGAVFLVSALSSVVSGWLSDHWVEAGPSGSRVRKLMFVVGLAGSGVSLMAAMIVPATVSVALLVAAGAFYGIANPLLFAGAQTLAGPSAAGQWMGAQNFAGNLAGIIAPALTGFLVDLTGNFIWAVAVLGVLTFVGALAWLFVVGPIAPVSWAAPRSAAPERTPA
ncbi:MAG TPA: MFS transporter [Candidatus Acidoferrum sp.]|nr:MFS transporter [Candidatus Acidoferrum sp.]